MRLAKRQVVYRDINVENLQHRCIVHPNPDIDLAVIPIGAEILNARTSGNRPFFIPIEKALIPSLVQASMLSAVDEVIMVGYPNGLWDSRNNLAIFRRGVLATHPEIDYGGKPEMMIDAACFSGSSGSQLYFLGILYAGPQQTVEGEIVVKTVPTNQAPLALTKVMINLGFVIRSALLDFLWVKNSLEEEGGLGSTLCCTNFQAF